MLTVDVEQAKRQIDLLLQKAEQGEDVLIVRADRPVARLIAARSSEVERHEAIRRLRSFAAGRRLDGLTLRDLREEGRR